MSSNFADFPTLRRLKTHRPTFADNLKQNQSASLATREKCLSFPYGTNVSIHIVRPSGKRRQVPVRKCSDMTKPNTFLALFEENNVDFEVDIDNRNSKDRHVSLDLDINEKTYGFVIPRNSWAIMETVESNGRKFHFSTTDNNYRKSVLNLSDRWSTLSRSSNIAYSISQIKFKVQYSNIVALGSYEIFVKTPKDRIYSVEVCRENTLEDVKATVRRITDMGQVIEYARFYIDATVLLDDLTLGEQGIEEGSMIHIILEPDPLSPDSTIILTEESHPDSIMELSSIADADVSSSKGDTSICSGGKSDQHFFSKGFDVDTSISIEPFVIELRKVGSCGLL